MKLPIIATLLCSVVLPADFQNQASSSIRGQTYLSHAGILLTNIEIALVVNDVVVRRITIGEDGTYEIRDLRPGNYVVRATGSGFVVSETRTELKGGERKLVNIGLELGRSGLPAPQADEISGTVRASSREPIADATVVFVDPYNQQSVERAITDAAGRYRARTLGSHFVVYAAKPGFSSSATILSFDGQWSHSPDQLDLTLAPLRSARR